MVSQFNVFCMTHHSLAYHIKANDGKHCCTDHSAGKLKVRIPFIDVLLDPRFLRLPVFKEDNMDSLEEMGNKKKRTRLP